MKLFEYEGKQLFKLYNIPIAKGWLFEDYPETYEKPVVVKAQVLSGGRGKQGGIIKVNKKDEVQEAVEMIANKRINGEKVSNLYIEECVSYIREIYLSIIIDRNVKTPVLIASPEGGVDIEEVPSHKILKIPINPLIGLQQYMITKLTHFLNLPKDHTQKLINKMWDLFTIEEAQLIEINPLFLTEDNQFIAGDSKVILDDDARKQPDLSLLPREQDNFEEKVSSLGTVGVEMDGDIAVITSGAGLGIATIDLVKSNKGTIRSFIDLGGHVFNDMSLIKELIAEVQNLKPKKFLFNFYFQMASCMPLTEVISEMLGDKPYSVYVRLKGTDEDKAYNLLAQHSNIYVTDSLINMATEVVK